MRRITLLLVGMLALFSTTAQRKNLAQFENLGELVKNTIFVA